MNFLLIMFAIFRLNSRENLFPGLGEKEVDSKQHLNWSQLTGRKLRTGGGGGSSFSSSKIKYKIGIIDEDLLLIKMVVVGITCTLILIKILFYLKVFKDYGKIVTLIYSIGV